MNTIQNIQDTRDTQSPAQQAGRWLLAVLGVMALEACGPPPKVLVDNKFFGEKRTAKVLMQQNADSFDQYLRICSLDTNGKESNCKDTLVLDRVIPSSLY